MKVPPFKLDAWLVAHEFATPPIRYNLASSTGPLWTLAELMALGDDRAAGARKRSATLTLSYAPPQGSKLLRERIAALHGVEPDDVLVMTGASEALMALTCLFAEPGASIVVPAPGVPGGAGAGARLGPGRARVRRWTARTASRRPRTACWRPWMPATRAVFVNTPHNPTGSVMPANEQRKLAEALAARGIPLIVDEVYHPLYLRRARAERQRSCPTPSCSATSPRRCRFRACASAGSSIAMRARREALLDMRSYFTISGSPLTEAIGAHALAHATEIIARLHAGGARQPRAAHAVHGRASRAPWTGRRRRGGTTCFPWLRDGRDARPMCEALAKAGVLAAPGDCFEMPAHFRIGFGAMRSGYAEALEIFRAVLARLP